MSLDSYIEKISKRYALGNATEHTFRGDLQNLLEELVPGIAATNEPKRIECGAPDYVLSRNNIPVGYVEAKDVDVDLSGKTFKEQFDRYRDALENLAFTDYLDFHFYASGTLSAKIKVGEIENGKIVSLPQNFQQFTNLIKEFCGRNTVTIRSSKRLAEMMAEKAKVLAYIIKNALDEDIANERQTELTNQLKAFKDILIHDIDPKAFADIYAQTIAYGMFAARLHDPTLPTFSRQEAAELIPKTNPFLRKLFQFIATYDLDSRISWIVDALADLFRATDIAAILKNFGKSTRTHDPIMHFYETFLAEYDPKLRKSRGVFYTPEPVVDFIVRAVDDILKSEFNLPAGLADTSKTKIKVDVQGKLLEQEVHKVQILDPATGTGTFLASVIKHIHKRFEGQQGIWGDYVENHLIPRLNGFELLMASYAMAHLKLDLLLSETGYSSAKDKRFQVYLTNALEEYHPDTGTLFASWLSSEANEANHIKRDTPVMVVIGNPPYSGESANKGEWIMSLMNDYKKEPGGLEKLKERNPKWINDDYVKFLRYGQHFVERNGEGILAFINPHGFLDNPTFRGMRWNLLTTYDKIYVLDLHGNTTKQETCPDGSPDVNVFDIMQGVSINILVKTGRKKKDELGEVLHFDLFGKRDGKYSFLLDNQISTVPYSLLRPKNPRYYMIPFDFDAQESFDKGILITELLGGNNMGITSGDDDNRIAVQSEMLLNNFDDREKVHPISYRPFDNRHIYYDPTILARARFDFMTNLNGRDNLALTAIGQSRVGKVLTPLIAAGLIDKSIVSSVDNAFIFPLYLYPRDNAQPTLDGRTDRVPNLNSEILERIAATIGLTFTSEKVETDGRFAPIDILDYIYAVLHSPSYREKYKEFLKIDFPRVPYPRDAATFWELVALGGELRQIHLLESPKVEQFITQFNVAGPNLVDKIEYKNGSVYINPVQHFAGVPEIAWKFYIGGYQPAQKWLKDRKGRRLDYDDIQHYQKIIVALTETDRLMKEIDKIEL